LRILQVHNYYQWEGGEDTVVAAERWLLESAGHTVELYAVDNAAISSVMAKARTFRNVVYNDGARIAFSKTLSSFRPDIVHVHNFFPLLSPSIYDAAAESNIPVVQTLQNFRTICAGATMFRDGQACELCLDGRPYRAVVYRCYRGSILGSLAVANMIAYHRRKGTWSTAVTRYIALTSFARDKFIEAGFPPERIVIKPNFIADPGPPAEHGREGALFVGRLSAEKGADVLLRAWPDVDYPLRILGDGPELATLRRRASSRILFEGHVGRDRVQAAMQTARFLVLPSLWYEGLPMTVIEAFANGLPVVASRLGALPELIEDGVTGCLFAPGDVSALAAATNELLRDPKRLRAMSIAARERYESLYKPERNRDLILSVYADAIAGRSSGS
jgi:glycosyltransferase involved in cell wall biosynthesis